MPFARMRLFLRVQERFICGVAIVCLLMPHVRYVTAKCAVCGEQCRYAGGGPVSAVGARDLDTRPPEPLRSTIYRWVHRCPSCGYCAPDMSRMHPLTPEIVRHPAYREQLEDRTIPDLANSFLCWAMIQEHAGMPAKAAWSCLHAAWVCDDRSRDAAAEHCRRRAIALLRQARERGVRLAPQRGADEAILVDLLRRTGEFEEARALAEESLAERPEPMIAAALRLQRALIARSDRGCHSLLEVQRMRGTPPR
ncbi:hypothetical protein ASZ90_010503 [hydrocarbon metagenome]|uniref:DUF2225 domain-containing protein n=1 Tax=hydrocarbon metagenome TaxID=938273 RepID=A0A0W8FFS9_9ZZZZ